MTRPSLYCAILAAGGAKRFGSNKLLTPLANGRLLDRALQLSPCKEHSLVVIGAYHTELQNYLSKQAYPGQVIYNPHWEKGLGESIATAIRHLPKCDGVLILLGDQIGVLPQHINLLYSKWFSDPLRLVCAAYADTIGVPAIFPARLFDQLKGLTGDAGAKSLIQKVPDRITLPLTAAAVDIDTPEQLIDYRRGT